MSAGVAVPSLDPIVEIAVKLFDVPAAAVNMIGSDHVFFAASAGVGECDMGRDVSFCAHAITQDGVMVVADALLDPRFHDNPLVTGGLIRFYAGVPLRAPSGHPLGALCIVDSEPHAGFDAQDRARLKDLARLASDKLELRRLEVANQARPSAFAAIAATSPNAVICFDQARLITAWNPAAVTMFGYAAEEAIARDIALLMPGRQHSLVKEAIARVLGGGAPPAKGTSLFTGVRKDGTHFPAELTWSHWREGEELHFGAIVQDVTDRLQQEDALYRLANYDSLTGLPNRNLIHSNGAAALQAEETIGIVMIDLDGFKDVNETLGHAVGDAILRETGMKLQQAVPPGATVARIGGDEFAILLPGIGDPSEISAISGALVAAIAQPNVVDGHEVRVAASCGLAISPQHGETVVDLLGSAGLALFQAKTGGRGGSFLYVPALRAEAVARRMYDAELHRAVERGELRLHYQPQIRLSDGALVGAEALIRWQHPTRNLLQPAAFLPALEGGPLAATVGAWILDAACAQAKIWRQHHPDFRVGVNLFAAQFRADDLPRTVAETLARHSLPASALELEITENIVLDQVELVLPQLRAVDALGVSLAFDDFGTGYASLNLLKDYPISHIKIDRSFIQTMQDSAHDRAIVTSLIQLSHQLDLKVIAEGVETDGQRAFLHAHRCEEGQGYFFGSPMAAELFAEKFALTEFESRARA
ncbi:MAG: putative bifunctional diguanylate cyclase/phosphodiesterase [Sphingosinicella sp.]|uniref:putative bifunctional diguanylate cyclase/phosphodiesterase n=1 Tax=Sphingosinicella sp. TaxID=1917971 RepID=UPI0040383D8B